MTRIRNRWRHSKQEYQLTYSLAGLWLAVYSNRRVFRMYWLEYGPLWSVMGRLPRSLNWWKPKQLRNRWIRTLWDKNNSNEMKWTNLWGRLECMAARSWFGMIPFTRTSLSHFFNYSLPLRWIPIMPGGNTTDSCSYKGSSLITFHKVPMNG